MVCAVVTQVNRQWSIVAGPVRLYVTMDGNGHVRVQPAEGVVGVYSTNDVSYINLSSRTPPELEAYAAALACAAKLIKKERGKARSVA